mmetsp:Transcript_22829/g.70944  ORF Transcript_22829/g.70944 Transcript_22829/m.70944 type:complete len:326 (-) Transcript_22829:2734-3711(-)
MMSSPLATRRASARWTWWRASSLRAATSAACTAPGTTSTPALDRVAAASRAPASPAREAAGMAKLAMPRGVGMRGTRRDEATSSTCPARSGHPWRASQWSRTAWSTAAPASARGSSSGLSMEQQMTTAGPWPTRTPSTAPSPSPRRWAQGSTSSLKDCVYTVYMSTLSNPHPMSSMSSPRASCHSSDRWELSTPRTSASTSGGGVPGGAAAPVRAMHTHTLRVLLAPQPISELAPAAGSHAAGSASLALAARSSTPSSKSKSSRKPARSLQSLPPISSPLELPPSYGCPPRTGRCWRRTSRPPWGRGSLAVMAYLEANCQILVHI